ncbi:MAG: hypothetical protein GMKNLPBB_00480 [Myxococcota bacterium]|nr:hypothetical protein [Myxococcota bacterium]
MDRFHPDRSFLLRLAGLRAWLLMWVVPCLLAGTPAQAAETGWTTVETRKLKYQFQPRMQPLLEEIIAEGDAVLSAMEQDLGVSIPPKTLVRVAGDEDEYKSMWPEPGAPEWSEGLAFPHLNVVVIRYNNQADDLNAHLREVFVHELAHIALLHPMQGRRPPHWVSEGYSMWKAREWTFEHKKALAFAALTDSLLSFGGITRGFPPQAGRAALAYAQSASMTRWLMDRHGIEPYRAWIQRMMRGEPADASMTAAFGVPAETLFARWREEQKAFELLMPVVLESGVLWIIPAAVIAVGLVRVRRRARKRLAALPEDDLSRPWLPEADDWRK